MDLGIAGKKAIVGGASAGLGRACAMSLAREGVELTIVSRTRDNIEAAAEEIRKETGSAVTAIAVDITSDEGRAAVLAACPEPDILVNNSGGPPTGNYKDWDREAWFSAINGNMLYPIFMIKDTIDGMKARKWGRIVNVTSSAVKAPINVLGLSNGARAGLTGFIAGLARDVAAHGITVNNVMPGDFETDRHTSNTEAMAKREGKSFDEMKAIRVGRIPAGRYGDPSEFGDFVAFVCSEKAAFVTAQNLLLDGGKYPGTF
jgi:3-oxoacyl-[acyl-carrier protein] reductase